MPATGMPGRTQQIADGGFGHNGSSQHLFQDLRPVQGGAFHGQRAIGIGTNMYTPRHLATDILHSLSSPRLAGIASWLAGVSFWLAGVFFLEFLPGWLEV